MSHVLDRSSGESAVTKPDHGRILRLDIEGMRAIAVGSVLAFHAGLPFFAGGFVGVDMFFVLSGFLVTGLLAREVSRTGRVRIAHFWARRVKRLLPASATVLVFSALVTYFYLPITQRASFGGDIVSAALYTVNWRLAGRSVDYLAEDVGASPVQHYWSLSVEEQFYLIWPLLMLAVAIFAAKRWRLGAFGALGLVTVTSFGYAVAQSHSSPETAFFVSTTRIWELGVGALLALSAAHVGRLPVVLRAVGGWVGLAAILYAATTFDGSTTWPGTATLVPVLGAALMIASGIAPTPGSPQRMLSVKPMVWIGGLSYSLYLWHWPILIAAQAKYPDLRLRWMVLLVVLAIIPSWLCHKYIENPVRFGASFRPTGRALAMGAALTALGVGVGVGLNASASIGGVVQRASSNDAIGARALLDKANAGKVWSDVKSVNRLKPLPTAATSDLPAFYNDGSGCQLPKGISKPKLCISGDKNAKKTMVIVGDSKMAQWQTVLSKMGSSEGFKVIQITKSACGFTDAAFSRPDKFRSECRTWGRLAFKDILRIKPDLVVTSGRSGKALPAGSTDPADQTAEALIVGLRSYWGQIADAGIPVAALLDNPAPPDSGESNYECVARHEKDLTRCTFSKAAGIEASAAVPERKAAKGMPGVSIIDMTDVVCPDATRCAPVIGNVLVFRQGSHLTKTFIDSMEPQLAVRLDKLTKGTFGASSH
ncbi:acyltransferase family protein [Aeromicrobium sp.]|uniref:acyltransferase family protein n=1 Tax=Aeromicrobium sp. TaxID=1871063 RepID=UPI0019AF3568|nr:acyltransferase family protein [Aeromicrobium sp.]MBC7630247.1 acyltransferase [Aeromicrobium sp.]